MGGRSFNITSVTFGDTPMRMWRIVERSGTLSAATALGPTMVAPRLYHTKCVVADPPMLECNRIILVQYIVIMSVGDTHCCKVERLCSHVGYCLFNKMVSQSSLNRWRHGHGLQPTAKAMAKRSQKRFGIGSAPFGHCPNSRCIINSWASLTQFLQDQL